MSKQENLWSYQVKLPGYFRSAMWQRTKDCDDTSKGKRKVYEGQDNKPKPVESDTVCVGSVGGDEVNAVEGSSFIEIRKRQKRFEVGRKFQEHWPTIFPWCEKVERPSGEQAQVKCLVCSKIEGVPKILHVKMDTLRKHASRKKASKDIPALGVKSGEFYIDHTCHHLKNEKLVLSLRRDTVVQQLAVSASILRRKKLVQFKVIIHLLAQGRPMSDYPGILALLKSLKVPEIPNKHWCESSGWEIAHAMCKIVADKTQSVIAATNFLSLSADEVMSVDNQQWLSIHVYTMKDWERIPILLSMSRVVNGCGSENLKNMITSQFLWHSGILDTQLSKKLICFGADGASFFQGSRTGVCAQLTSKHAPYMMRIHCMAHMTNLAVQAIGVFPVVKKLENLCQSLNLYLGHSPKCALQCQVLSESLHLEGLKILRNVKTRWISVYDPIVWIRDSYQTLVVQMAIQCARKSLNRSSKKGAASQKNLNMLCDLQTFLAIPCILPLLTLVHDLIKFAQGRDVFICDYVADVNMCIVDLQSKYVDSEFSYSAMEFLQLTEYLENRTYVMQQVWNADSTSGVEHLHFCIAEKTYLCHYVHAITSEKNPVTRTDFAECVLAVKRQCTEAASCLIGELKDRFPDSDLMSALGIVFPQFWRSPRCDSMFLTHLSTIKKFFGTEKSINNGYGVVQVAQPLSSITLDEQAATFKATMKNQCDLAMGEPFSINPLTKLWRYCGANPLLRLKMSEYFLLAEIVVTCVIGSVEDERTFSTLTFLKTKIRNKLTVNLDCVVKMFAQSFYGVDDFPFEDAITGWLETRDRRSVRD